MTDPLDLDAIERAARLPPLGHGATPAQTLALVRRVREAEAVIANLAAIVAEDVPAQPRLVPDPVADAAERIQAAVELLRSQLGGARRAARPCGHPARTRWHVGDGGWVYWICNVCERVVSRAEDAAERDGHAARP